MPIANNFQSNVTIDDYRFELSTGFCEFCALFQIIDQPDPNLMFHSGYPFFTGLSSSMAAHFRQVAEEFIGELKSTSLDPFIVEVGSNDGTFLTNFVRTKIRHLGVDPSKNVVEIARTKGVNCLDVFFGKQTAFQILEDYGSADIIFGANVICHLPNLEDFVQGLKTLLSKGGKFVFEEPEVKEKENGLLDLGTFIEFAKKCAVKKQKLLSLLRQLKQDGKRVAGYGATSKSTTVLNYCGIDSSLIEIIVDATPEKQGSLTPGSHIPIISDNDPRIKEFDYFVLFAWNHQKEIIAKENARGNSDFNWISFVPDVEILK
jgi:SAM-dependent methyltransferase